MGQSTYVYPLTRHVYYKFNFILCIAYMVLLPVILMCKPVKAFYLTIKATQASIVALIACFYKISCRGIALSCIQIFYYHFAYHKILFKMVHTGVHTIH